MSGYVAGPGEGLPGRVAARLGDDKKAFSVLMSLLNAFAAKADARRSAGGLVAALAGSDLFDGDGPHEGQLPGVEFLQAVADRPLAAKLELIGEYLALCRVAPSLTVAQYFAEIVGPREAVAPPAGPAGPPDAAPQKPDASFTIPVPEMGLRIAIDKKAPQDWRVLKELEPGLWFHVELKFPPETAYDPEAWYLDAFLAYDADGRLLAADSPAHVGGKVHGAYKFYEAQRWVTVETVPQVALPPGPDD